MLENREIWTNCIRVERLAPPANHTLTYIGMLYKHPITFRSEAAHTKIWCLRFSHILALRNAGLRSLVKLRETHNNFNKQMVVPCVRMRAGDSESRHRMRVTRESKAEHT